MSLNNFWDEYELFFHTEFINTDEFPQSKKDKLETESGMYWIKKDFTLYQEKSVPLDEINKLDKDRNHFTFMRLLYHMHYPKVYDFIEFHYGKYSGDKKTWLNYVYREFKGSKLKTTSGKELPPYQQKLMLLEWCEEKLFQMSSKRKYKKVVTELEFINDHRIAELENIENNNFDLRKLIKMLNEINDSYSLGNYFSVAMLGRSVINHVPPIFGFDTFNKVANNYGGQSFKKNMTNLNNSMKNIADNYLHEMIRNKEVLPNENQVDFGKDMDVLLSEIVRIL
jgi:hypothetical protein